MAVELEAGPAQAEPKVHTTLKLLPKRRSVIWNRDSTSKTKHASAKRIMYIGCLHAVGDQARHDAQGRKAVDR